MTLTIQLDSTSGLAPFEQIRSQILEQIDDSSLRVGERLPPIRALASDLAVAAGTVARAYRELEIEGVLETRGRSGTVVANTAVRAEVAARQAAKTYLDAIRRLGLGTDSALTILTDLIDNER